MKTREKIFELMINHSNVSHIDENIVSFKFKPDDFEKLIEDISQLSQPSDVSDEWISIKDNLPTERCLLLTASKLIVIGDWYNGIWRAEGANEWKDGKLTSIYSKEDITHWMKFPSIEPVSKITDNEIEAWAESKEPSWRTDVDTERYYRGRILGAKAMRDGQIKPTIEGEQKQCNCGAIKGITSGRYKCVRCGDEFIIK